MSVPASNVVPEKQDTGWYLVYTKPKCELVARDNLWRQGYATYLPLVQFSKRRRGRYHTVTEPMFSRYLFIQLSKTTDNWAPIRSTLGVSAMVRFSGYPARVPDELIRLLKDNEDVSGIQQIPVQEIRPGSCVQIIEGPMTGYTGIYQAQSSVDRAVILLDVVGKNTRVMVDRHDLKLAE